MHPSVEPRALAVVITTHDNPAGMSAVLGGLANQREAPPETWQVILVDNGSADRIADLVARSDFPFPITIVEQRHTGEAWARNEGWRRASADVVAFLDDNLVPDANFAIEHVRAHSRHRGAVVLGSVVHEPGRAGNAWTEYDRTMLEAKFARLSGRERPSGIHVGGNFSLPRATLERTGGFDNRLPIGAHVDLGFRLKRLGVEFVYEPGARVIQRGEVDFDSWQLRHRLQGRLDVAVFREREHAGGLKSLVACYHDRHPANRLVLRAALGTRLFEAWTVRGARRLAAAAHAARVRPLSRAAMSVVANVTYWGGVRDGLRGNEPFWSLIRSTRKHRGRPYEMASRVGA